MISDIQQGQALEWIWGPWCEGGQSGARVGYGAGAGIEVGQFAGPMGWYDVAVISRSDGSPDEIMPLHMAECMKLAPVT